MASGRILGKALATLKFTVPHRAQAVAQGLERMQKAVDRLVLGTRGRWLQATEAYQPRCRLGLGHLRVEWHMQAVWLRPLLAAMGADAGHRPYKQGVLRAPGTPPLPGDEHGPGASGA